MINEICSYGCNQPAKFKLGNRFCCEDSWKKCPEKRKQSSLRAIQGHKEGKLKCTFNNQTIFKAIPLENGDIQKCNYCGERAGFQISKKFCCKPSINSCPEMKSKNSSGKTGTIKKVDENSLKGNTLEHFWGVERATQYRKEQSERATYIWKNKILAGWKPSVLSPERENEKRRKISLALKGRPNPASGFREKSGWGKQGWYKGYWCQSSYELAFVVYHLDHGIQFERNREGFPYTIKDTTHKYYPDFKLGDGYIEVKGFLRESDKEKFKQFPLKLTVLFLEDMNYIFEYVHRKYGKKFIELYESTSINKGEKDGGRIEKEFAS